MNRQSTLVVVAACLIAACGGSDSKVTVGTSAATGSIGGVVLDATAGLPPLAGATVTVIAGGATQTATTDANGVFAVNGVAAGTVIVKISSMDHFDIYITGHLDSAAGNFPVSNSALTVGPVVMLGNKGTLTLRLVDEEGAPASMIKVTARANASYLDLSSGASVERGLVDAGGTSGTDGVVTITGLPDYAAVGPLLTGSVKVNVPPVRISGANSYQFLGLTVEMFPAMLGQQTGQTLTPTIVLAGPHSPLTVLASNVDFLVTGAIGQTGSIVPSAGPINIIFNQAIDATSVRAQLVTEFGNAAPVTVTPAVNANQLALTFNKLDDASRYNLVLHANTLYTAQQKALDVVAPFFTTVMNTAVTVTNASRFDPNDLSVYILNFSEPVGLGGASTGIVPCVVFYEADLDGNTNVLSPGEWSSGGNAQLKCDIGNGHAGLYMVPAEPSKGVTAQSMPLTGFSTQWRITVKDSCFNNFLCQMNLSNRPVHLVFSRNNDPKTVFKRANGVTVMDMIFTLPSF